MSKASEQGFIANVIVVFVLLAGIGVGIYLVTHPQIFKSKATVDGTRIEVVDGSGDPITVIATQSARLKLTSVPEEANHEVKVMVIQYIPPGGVNSVYPGAPVPDPTNFIKNSMIPAMTSGTKFHGYSDSASQPVITFTLANEDIHTINVPPPMRQNNYLGAPDKAANQPGYLDLPAIFSSQNICNEAQQKDIRVVILMMADYGVYGPKGFEDYITGNKGIPTNGPILRGSQYCDDRTIYIVAPVYTRGLAEALESYGHHLENVFRFYQPTDYRAWSDEGAARNGSLVGKGDSCGTVHNPPNARCEYDAWNPVSNPDPGNCVSDPNLGRFQSDCRNWKADGTGAEEALDCHAWGCNRAGWEVWWMQNAPSSWWSYVANPDAIITQGDFSNLSANLCGSRATFSFNYSGYSPSFTVEMGGDPNSFTSGFGIYHDFASGVNSPVVETNVSKMGQYTIGRNMSWRIKTNNVTSSVQTATVVSTCQSILPSPSSSPVSISTYPSHFRIANSAAFLNGALEQVFTGNGQIIDWLLSEGEGQKTIYAQFKVNGVWENTISTSVLLQTSTPTPSPTSSPTPTPPAPTLVPSPTPTSVPTPTPSSPPSGATGTITCTPVSTPATGLSTYSISATYSGFTFGYPSADICVKHNGGNYVLFAGGGGPDGSINKEQATWIQRTHSYQFTLFNIPPDGSRCEGEQKASCQVNLP